MYFPLYITLDGVLLSFLRNLCKSKPTRWGPFLACCGPGGQCLEGPLSPCCRKGNGACVRRSGRTQAHTRTCCVSHCPKVLGKREGSLRPQSSACVSLGRLW